MHKASYSGIEYECSTIRYHIIENHLTGKFIKLAIAELSVNVALLGIN